MSDTQHDKQHSEDEDSQPQDIRSRIAAFEHNRSPAVAASPNSTSSGATASSVTRKTPHGSYDPLQAASSPPKVKEPIIIKPLEKPRAPPAVPGVIKPASFMSSRVALPGLGAPNPSSSSNSVAATNSTSPNAARPSPLSQTRPWPPVKSSTESDVSAAISNAMDDTASIDRLKAAMTPGSSVPATPLASSPTVTSSSSTLPPPPLPVRKNSNTSNKSASSSFTNVSVLSSEPSTLSTRVPPPLPGGKPVSSLKPASTPQSPADASAPRLPPRKQNSISSTMSNSSTLSSYPQPPQRSSTLLATSSPGTTPAQSRSSSISLQSGLSSSRPSRSSTMQSDSSSLSAAPSLSSLPPRPRDQSYPNTHFMSPPPSRSMPPPPNNLSRAPSPRHTTANGSRSSVNLPALPQRYEVLWDKLVQSFAQQNHSTAGSASARLDGIVVRQVWKLSKLNAVSLARIWNQCDINRQGSLDKRGFCKGLSLIDAELRQKRRRQGRT